MVLSLDKLSVNPRSCRNPGETNTINKYRFYKIIYFHERNEELFLIDRVDVSSNPFFPGPEGFGAAGWDHVP